MAALPTRIPAPPPGARPTPLSSALSGLIALLVSAFTSDLALTVAAAAAPVRPPSWRDIDNLRALLEASGSTVVQRDCNQHGLHGLFHQQSQTIVICRVHRNPASVWNTLTHEATHKMQACAGGTITRPEHHRVMAQSLALHAPEEWRSLRLYPRSEQLGELEARYTARLDPAQVPQLFRRYCGGQSLPSTLTQRR